MSQKYKSFAKGLGSDFNTVLPPSVKRVGYLRKLKKMKRRFFVLHMESETGDARLEYYSSEKKWRAGCEPRRSIQLKTCLNISRKLHSKQKNVIALYTQDDCFSVVAETSEDLELWLDDMLEVQRKYLTSDESKSRPIFEHLWQVEIDKHDLENAPNLSGPYRVALSSKSLTLIKMNPSNEFDYYEFPLMSIRRCGHSKDHFFIELGRSAVTGAGEIYMATEGTIIAQNMHETVLSAMKSSKVREDGNPLPRPRSASTSENSNPVATRRPVGVVAPQTLNPACSNTLSNSRERCDSLPTRPRTLSENPHSCIFNALSSPNTSSGASLRRLSSRPHSMYEWPSFNSPSNRITSPFSLSSNGGYASSNEEVDNIRQSSSFHFQVKSSDGSSLCSDRPITEVPDEYLMMSPTEASKPESTSYMAMKQSKSAPSDGVSYIDMKSVKMESGLADGREENVSGIQDGYLSMSPSAKTYLKNFNDINSLERTKTKFSVNFGGKPDKKEFILEKVSSLVKVPEGKRKIEPLKDRNSSSTSVERTLNQSMSVQLVTDSRVRSTDIPFPQTYSKENENLSQKPPLPERTYKNNKNCSGPPIPARRNEFHANSLNSVPFQKSDNCNSELKCYKNDNVIPENEDLSRCMPENSVFEEHEVFAKSNFPTDLVCMNKDSSSDLNTNFSQVNQNDKSKSNVMPCASTSTARQIPFQQDVISYYEIEQNQNQSVLKNIDGSDSCIEVCHQTHNYPNVHNQNSAIKPENQNINLSRNFEETVLHSCGDYVNLEFKKSGSSNLFQSATNSFANKNAQLIPNPLTMDANYSNIHFGKPFCPIPNPVPASVETSPFSCASKVEKSVLPDQNFTPPVNNNSGSAVPEDARSPKVMHSFLNCAPDLNVALPGKMRNIPNTLPAFRKQMSAPAAPPSLRAELPSPGRKSSCPVTACSNIMKPPLPTTTVVPVRPVFYHQGSTSGHLRISTSRSPDHSSVSSISSASDEISSNHSSPKILGASQSFGVSKSHTSDSRYENVVIPQRPSTSRPPSVSSEKELNYASLDLTPSTRSDGPRSPTVQKPTNFESTETLLYAEIDFKKSEGLRNTSGAIREGRL